MLYAQNSKRDFPEATQYIASLYAIICVVFGKTKTYRFVIMV